MRLGIDLENARLLHVDPVTLAWPHALQIVGDRWGTRVEGFPGIRRIRRIVGEDFTVFAGDACQAVR